MAKKPKEHALSKLTLEVDARGLEALEKRVDALVAKWEGFMRSALEISELAARGVARASRK